MYFLSDEEHERLVKFFLPRSRELSVADDLRGWNWNHPPLEPIYDLRLGIAETSSRYCPTNRDLFLQRVHKVKMPPNESMIFGFIFHAYLCNFVTASKRAIYLYYEKGSVERILKEVEAVDPLFLEQFQDRLDERQVSDASKKLNALHRYEFLSFGARLEETLSRQPHIGADALVASVLPVVVERKLDGTRLGLSPYLSCDAVYLSEPIIVDLKFGPRRDFHFLGPTGYGLVMESLYEYPINVGCVVYVNFKNDSLRVEKDFRILSDELRQAFIEERDEKMRMIYEEIDPGMPEECYEPCHYLPECKSA